MYLGKSFFKPPSSTLFLPFFYKKCCIFFLILRSIVLIQCVHKSRDSSAFLSPMLPSHFFWLLICLYLKLGNFINFDLKFQKKVKLSNFKWHSSVTKKSYSKVPPPKDRRWVPSQRTDARIWWAARRGYQGGAQTILKVPPPKGPTPGSENFAQNVGPWSVGGGDFTVDKVAW